MEQPRTKVVPLVLGILAVVVSVAPIAAFVLMMISDRFATAAMITIIVCVGCQLPLWTIFSALAGDRVPPSERSMLLGRWRHPFTLIEFWWRYLR